MAISKPDQMHPRKETKRPKHQNVVMTTKTAQVPLFVVSSAKARIDAQEKNDVTTRQRAKSAPPTRPTVCFPAKPGVKEQHWMTWKTGSTPPPPKQNLVPPTKASRPNTPMPTKQTPHPMSPFTRPASSRPSSSTGGNPAYSRCSSASSDSLIFFPVERVPSITPQPVEEEYAAGYISVTPKPLAIATCNARQHGGEGGSPHMLRDEVDYHKTLRSPQDVYRTRGFQPTSFEPELQSWAAKASEEEKDVAYNLLKALSVGMNALKIQKTNTTNKPRTSSAGPALCVHRRKNPNHEPQERHVFKPMKPPKTPTEEEFMKQIHKSREQADPKAYPSQSLHRSKSNWPSSHIAKPKYYGYTHGETFFQNPKPHYRSYFCIDPQWISETMGGPRKCKVMMCTEGGKGMRYMSQKPCFF